MNNSVQIALAGRGKRFAATIVDFILVPALALALVIITGVMEDAEDYASSAFVWKTLGLAIVAYLILNGYLLWKRGQTIGKALVGISVVGSATGVIAPLWKLICIRAVFFPFLYPPMIVLGIIDLLFIFGGTRRCLHDFAAGTAVVDIKKVDHQ